MHRIGSTKDDEKLYGVIMDYGIARRKFNETVEHFVRENEGCDVLERRKEFVKIALQDRRTFFFALKPLCPA